MEKYVLVEYLSSLKNVICETFKSTQRIKLTSFDVSLNYISFGTSSGAIYVFKRKPCEFLRLIPSKEGPTIQLRISSNEKHLAVASSKGLVVILENFFVDGNLRPLVCNEHEGNIITEMKWHGTDLYCGDDVGKMSIFTISSLLTKAIFQTPFATLMQLDSSITQIDAYENYLLISTRTRTYLCDTEKEQYKQIGKKLRDGNFGACFSYLNNTYYNDVHQNSRGAYKTIKEDEDFSSNLSNTSTKIFCARPGVRLWEANFEASVHVTYQFRSTLKQNPSDIFVIEDAIDAKLRISKSDDEREVSKHFSFGKIYPVLQRFILTYDRDGVYFFHPEESQLLLWSCAFKDILDVRIVKSHIYIWRDGLELNIISLQSLENLLLSTLFNKQYYVCSELCLYHEDDISALVETSVKIHLLAILRTKLAEIGANEMLDQLKPMLDNLEGHYKKHSLGLKLENGIFVVENQHLNQTKECDIYLPESVETFNGESKQTAENQEKLGESNSKQKYMALYRQFILNKTHKNVELTETSNVFKSLNFDELFSLFHDFIKFVEEKDNEDATAWCQEQLIRHAAKGDFNISVIENKDLQYLHESFISVNKTVDSRCKCNFPLPKAHTKKIDYYKLACELYERAEIKSEYLNSIPVLYKYKLKKVSSFHEIMDSLPLITQFSDKEVFKEFIGMLTCDSWDEIIKLYIKLKQGSCLNCGHNINIDGVLTWSEMGLLVVESVGSRNAMKLLKRYSQSIPNGELDARFYQSCIFTTTCDDQRLGLNYMEKVANLDKTREFEEMLGRFIQRKYLGNHHQTSNLRTNVQSGACPICNLPIDTSVLLEIKKFACGHNFHNLCFPNESSMCNICMTTS